MVHRPVRICRTLQIAVIRKSPVHDPSGAESESGCRISALRRLQQEGWKLPLHSRSTTQSSSQRAVLNLSNPLQRTPPTLRLLQPNDKYFSNFPLSCLRTRPAAADWDIAAPVIATTRRETKSPFECRINNTTASPAITLQPASCLRRYCRLGRRAAKKIMERGKRVVEVGHR